MTEKIDKRKVTSPVNGRKSKGKRIEASFKLIEKEVNFDQVIYWIGLQATAEEIAGAFRVSTDTLDRRLKEFFGVGFAEIKNALGDGSDGKLSLRRFQFRQAENNASMAIWLGKQWLGQKDVQINETYIKENSVKIYLPDNGMNCKDE